MKGQPPTLTDESILAIIAMAKAQQEVLRHVPETKKQNAADRAEAIAMGILHGCCGPNGDFSA
jgi:hypothetical protein